ncbi:hypothetical protein MAPG_01395 [Magnaporthiopsis poae ATCC 64411]|uniref:Cyanovirin-N domain-containing protein n=1 Tax=Magnaporthiopsis poae (strain ATCC 64411 / 73-15) TaxID=644358 RepID=A0A0C4DNK3_MAGP6|nr:hypothetical protein MAPG_01395 [Magnaporthiopsis poae ATCC 64411]
MNTFNEAKDHCHINASVSWPLETLSCSASSRFPSQPAFYETTAPCFQLCFDQPATMNLFLFFSASFVLAADAVLGAAVGNELVPRTFFETCDPQHINGTTLLAKCQTDNIKNPKIQTSLDLKRCLKQVNGTLSAATVLKGQGLDGVRECILPYYQEELTCLLNCDGCPHQTLPFSLNGVIHNNNGKLECKEA